MQPSLSDVLMRHYTLLDVVIIESAMAGLLSNSISMSTHTN